MKAKADVTPDSLRDELAGRGITLEAAAVLAGLDTSAISRIVNGKRQARPETVVRLAKALGISARRMQAMADAAWAAAHSDEVAV